jgi:putative transposase
VRPPNGSISKFEGLAFPFADCDNLVMPPLDYVAAPHRKKVRHFDLPGNAHFLTFSCFRRLPLLSKDRTRKWVVDAIELARRKHDFHLWAWVIMSEHVHLLIYPRSEASTIAQILADIKRPVGQRAIAFLVERKSPYLERLTVRNRNRIYRRFWQAGPGQDHNIYDPDTSHRVVEYIHNNPVTRGLVQSAVDWCWSSARDWAGAVDVLIRVDRTLPAIREQSR